MRFSDWLRNSNEAKPLRDALEATDALPAEFGLKRACFEAVQSITESVWEDTKKDLDL